MDFGDAVDALRRNERVFRRGWNGAEMFLFFIPGETVRVDKQPLISFYSEGTEINQQPYIMMKNAQGAIVPWAPSQSDVLSGDWEIVQDKMF